MKPLQMLSGLLGASVLTVCAAAIVLSLPAIASGDLSGGWPFVSLLGVGLLSGLLLLGYALAPRTGPLDAASGSMDASGPAPRAPEDSRPSAPAGPREEAHRGGPAEV